MADVESRFDLSLMSEADKHNLFSTFLEACLRFYEDPTNIEKFERWKEQRDREGGNQNTE